MSSATHRHESTSVPALYVACELSKQEWLLTMSPAPNAKRYRVRVRAGDRAAIATAIRQAKRAFALAGDAPVRSCAEAGRDGFWPARLLTTLGIENVVVDSSSIEVPRRARRAKSDRLDGEKLLRMLLRYWQGDRDVWQVVRVPSAEAEDRRHASRALTTLQGERTRYRNRIHSLLALVGIAHVRIDAQLPARLAQLRDWAGAPIGDGLQARVLEQWRLLQAVELERRARRQAERARVATPDTAAGRIAQRLSRVAGIAARTATVLADELFTRALQNRRQVGALSGLVSAPYQSGETRRDQGLSRSGLPAIRRLAVQLAWGWLRYQPTSALTHWYHARFGRGGPGMRRLGIVALARRVMIALWRYVATGVLPEGAVLKA
jgi:transposase